MIYLIYDKDIAQEEYNRLIKECSDAILLKKSLKKKYALMKFYHS